MDDILLIFMNTAMLNASSIRFRQLIDVSDWRHRIPQWGHKQFWTWIRIKIFFYPSMHFQAIVSSKSLILKRNSALVYSFVVLQNFAILIFPLIFLNATCHFLSFQTRYFCLVLDSNCKFWHFDTSQFLVFCYRFTSKWQNFCNKI